MSPTSFQLLHPAILLPGAGLEPARGYPQRILSPLRLPIPPPRLIGDSPAKLLERETGFGPATPALARQCSTAELFPQTVDDYTDRNPFLQLRRAGFEPARPKALAPKASASASSATLACYGARGYQRLQRASIEKGDGFVAIPR